MEFVVFECLTECFEEEAEHKYDQSTAFGPFDSFEDAVNLIIDRMADVLEPNVSYSSVDDGPIEAHEYVPEITEEQVRTVLQEKQSYEIFGKKYEIRQLIN